jgi:hypothetical protein
MIVDLQFRVRLVFSGSRHHAPSTSFMCHLTRFLENDSREQEFLSLGRVFKGPIGCFL